MKTSLGKIPSTGEKPRLFLEIPQPDSECRQRLKDLDFRFTEECKNGKEQVVMPPGWRKRHNLEDKRGREITNKEGLARIGIWPDEASIEFLCRYSIRLKDTIIDSYSGKLRLLPEATCHILNGGRVSIWHSPKPISNIWAERNELVWRHPRMLASPARYVEELRALWTEAEIHLIEELKLVDWMNPGAYW